MAAKKSPDDSLQLVVSFEIKVGGKPLPKNLVVMKVSVKSEVNKVARAYLSIIGGKSYENLFPESELASFAPGKDVEISFGYAETTFRPGGFIGLGSNFGSTEKGSAFGVNIRYYFIPYPEPGVESTYGLPMTELGGLIITLSIGSMW
ncbi:MAG: hypothetical protein EB038_09490 [Cyclobacteriaceae bacterium]|nr:hypothetical protein [Cyclobacteriaceae bacterium]